MKVVVCLFPCHWKNAKCKGKWQRRNFIVIPSLLANSQSARFKKYDKRQFFLFSGGTQSIHASHTHFFFCILCVSSHWKRYRLNATSKKGIGVLRLQGAVLHWKVIHFHSSLDSIRLYEHFQNVRLWIVKEQVIEFLFFTPSHGNKKVLSEEKK